MKHSGLVFLYIYINRNILCLLSAVPRQESRLALAGGVAYWWGHGHDPNFVRFPHDLAGMQQLEFIPFWNSARSDSVFVQWNLWHCVW